MSRHNPPARSLTGASLILLIFLTGLSAPAGAAGEDPTPPAQVLAQGLSDTTIELTWMAAPGAETYVVYRDDVAITTEPGTLYDDPSLPASTTHTYQVSSIINGAESDRSTAATTATQAPQDHSPPTQPGLITVSQVKSASAVLKWKTATDDVAVVGYRILRGAPGAPVTSFVQVETAEALTYTPKNLKAGTSYQFAVVAIDAGNNTSPARSTTFTTQTTNDSTAPSAVSSNSVSTIPFSSTRIDVVWGASTSTDVAGYRVFRNGTQVAEIPQPLRRTYSDNGLLPATSYTYKVAAYDSAGNQSALTTGRAGTTTATGAVLIKRGPSIQWVTANFARVAWWTNVPASSTVSYGLGALTDQLTDPVLRTQHVMLIGGLSADTTYTYRAASGGVMAETSTFRTAAGPGSTFSFAAVGDFGGGSAQETAIANLIANGPTQFVQLLGDNVYPDSEDPDFATFYSDFDSRFYKQYTPVIKKQALWAGGGNHEYYGGTAFWQNFWMPNNERWYSFDWGDAHFLVLDTEQPFATGTPQYQFADADLAANQDKTWRIVVFHRPPYSSTSSNSSCTTCRQYLVPLLEQHDVQVALTAHSHNYERSYPLVGGVPRDTGGVTYFVSGGGGNGLNQFQAGQPSWSAFRAASFEYLQVTVSPSSIQVEAFTDADVLLDSVTIKGDEVASGAIAGTVTDAGTGGPLAGATVSHAGGSATTDQTGLYLLSDVPSGTHDVTASAAGYASQTVAVTVSSGQTTQQDFALSPNQHVPVFNDGFESGNMAAWTSSGGLTVQSAVVHSGIYAAQGNTTNGATYAKKTLPSSFADGYARVYFNLLSSSSQVNLLRIRTAAEASIAYLFVNTSGKLAMRNDTTATTTTSSVSVGAGWHSLELHAAINGTSSATEVWLDGALVGELSTTTNLGITPIGRVQIGEVAIGRTYNVVFDDAVFDTQRVGV